MKQTAITISMINQQGMNRTEGQTLRAVDGEQRMTSMEIAELTGKQHKHVMEAIRRMEPAWEKVQGTKFRLSQRNYELPTGGMKAVPCYLLTKTECLYIATKFNDEARARLVLRWQQLDELNRDSDDCYTPTDIGAPFGLEGRDLNSFLCDKGIIHWSKGQWRLTPKFMHQGLTEDRSFIYHGRNGHRKTQSRLVWTEKGRSACETRSLRLMEEVRCLMEEVSLQPSPFRHQPSALRLQCRRRCRRRCRS